MPHKSQVTENISLTEHDGLLIVTIDRPERKNAVNAAMWGEIVDIFTQQNDQHTIRAIILRGAGSDFSAGADISEFDSHRGDAESAAAYEALNEAAFAAVRDCTIPVIAEIRGICFGGGFGLAAAAHMRLADNSARFKVPAARLGLAYPVNSVQDIVHGVGKQQARRLLLAADELSPEEAYQSGFLMKLSPAETLADDAEALARKVIANAPISVKASQLALKNVAMPSPENLTAAMNAADRTFESDDYKEGRKAFKEKRAPVFRGR